VNEDDPVVPSWAGEAFEDEEEDGLAAERTELAWGRSSLALMVCGVAVARGVSQISGQTTRPLVGTAVLVLGVLAWAAGIPYARTRAIAARTGERHVVTARELAPLAIGTALVGLGGFLIALLMPV
jgi:uncharacterized membrane protein YidH (DUF202 family)